MGTMFAVFLLGEGRGEGGWGRRDAGGCEGAKRERDLYSMLVHPRVISIPPSPPLTVYTHAHTNLGTTLVT